MDARIMYVRSVSAGFAGRRVDRHVNASVFIKGHACINAAAFAHADARHTVRFSIVDLHEVAFAILQEDHGLIVALELGDGAPADGDAYKTIGVFYTDFECTAYFTNLDSAYITFTREHVLCAGRGSRSHHRQQSEHPCQ